MSNNIAHLRAIRRYNTWHLRRILLNYLIVYSCKLVPLLVTELVRIFANTSLSLNTLKSKHCTNTNIICISNSSILSHSLSLPISKKHKGTSILIKNKKCSGNCQCSACHRHRSTIRLGQPMNGQYVAGGHVRNILRRQKCVLARRFLFRFAE